MTTLPRSNEARAGFTLLEVMVAVVILAVGLSSLFTSQAGAIRIAQRARTTAVATLLARCKMGEIEEQIAKEGWPATALDGRDECCEGAEHEGYGCEWKVEPIVLPEAVELAEDGDEDALEQLKAGVQGDPNAPTPGAATPSEPGAPPPAGTPLEGIGALMGGGLGGDEESGAGDPIASLAMEFAFPIMKPIIEQQVRRVTVNVSWNEGSSQQSFDVVQYLVNELPVLLEPESEEADGSSGQTTGGGTTNTGSGSGSGSGSGGSTRSTGGGSSTGGPGVTGR